MIRGLLGSLGIRFPKGSAKLVMRVREALADHGELEAIIEPLLASIEAVKRQFERLDKTVTERAEADPACRLLMSAPGIGPLTSFAYVATIGDAERFAKSRTVGAYVGLTPRRWPSPPSDWRYRTAR